LPTRLRAGYSRSDEGGTACPFYDGACVALALSASPALADEQVIAPGTAQQDAVLVNTGASVYRLKVSKGSCPSATVSQIDADASTTPLDATAIVSKGGSVKASFVVSVHLEDVTTVASNVPFRCALDVDAIAADTDPDVDDAANAGNNSAAVAVDVTDGNDK
jgi:hypothetical protein